MKKANRVALVTGATGFIGSHLARQLVRDGWQVHIVTRVGSHMPTAAEFKQMINHRHDGSTPSMIRCVAQSKPDVVFHLASYVLYQHTLEDIDSLITSNLLFGTQLLEAMKINNINYIINTGTFWQHYNNESYNPVCLYAATKQAFESLLDYYVRAVGFCAVTLTLFDTYGPEDPRPKLFHLLKKAAVSGKPLDMSYGEQLIDLVHIYDVNRAYMAAAEHLLTAGVEQHEHYAVSSGHPMSLKELVELYKKVNSLNIHVRWGGRPYRYREIMSPWTLGAKIPGWSPTINHEEGLREALAT